MVVVVKIQSAQTTWRTTTATTAGCRVKLASNIWNAEPSPVPNSTVDDNTCSHLTTT